MASGISLRIFVSNATLALRNAPLSKLKGVRTFLSDAYRCQDVWDKRLESSLIKKINTDDMYYEIDQKFQQDGTISAVDVDIFAAAVRDDSNLDELEDLVHRLRLSENASKMLPATPHNLVRMFLATEHTDALLRVLNDRLNYGVFPDHYTANLLMDTFLKKKQFLEAAKVGILQMLQEDWEHPLTTTLSILSCLQHLRNPSPWDSIGQSIEPTDDSKEEIKVRVNFLRNPFFDDHFDLKESTELVGKTLAMLSPHLPSKALACSLELLGLVLRGKYEESSLRLQQWNKENKDPYIFKEVVTMVCETLQGAEGENQSALQAQLSSLPTMNGELVASLEKCVQEAASHHERSDIEQQIKAYAEWEKAREHELAMQLAGVDRQARLEKVEEKKRYLQEKEQRLYFFDREQEWDLKIEENQPKYRKRWFGKLKKKRVLDEAYVPPEIGRGSN